MKNWQVALVSFVVLATLLATCAPQAAPAGAPQSPAPSAPKPAVAPSAVAAPKAAVAEAWQVEWDKTVEAARKEGMVMVVTSVGPEVRRVVTDVFRSKFDIGIEWLAGSSRELTVKMLAERRAKIYSVDAGIVGYSAPVTILKPAGAVEPLDKVFFLPELTVPSEIQKAWRFGLEWTDKDHSALNFSSPASIPVAINTKFVKPGEIKSFRDLLDPKWRGKMAMLDPTMGAGPGQSFSQAVGAHIMGWDYLQKLVDQDLVLTRDPRLLTTWVAQGKYPVGIAMRQEMIKEFVDVGAPLEGVAMDEGGYTNPGANSVSLVKDAPHANAAKLFVNWLLSKDGQITYCTKYGGASNRSDVTIQGLNPLSIADPKKKYVSLGTEDSIQEMAEANKKAEEIFSKLKK